MHQYWASNEDQQQWRTWSLTPPPPDEHLSDLLDTLNSILRKRLIRAVQGQDILRWGKCTGGSFNLKEARHYAENRNENDKVVWHNNVWESNLWPNDPDLCRNATK